MYSGKHSTARQHIYETDEAINHLVSSARPCATTVVSSLASVAFLEVTSASQACMKHIFHVKLTMRK